MTHEKERAEQSGASGTTTPGTGGGTSSDGPGGGTGGPPNVDPMSLSCGELTELIGACNQQIGLLESQYEDTRKIHYRVRLKLQGAIGAWQDLLSRCQSAFTQRGC